VQPPQQRPVVDKELELVDWSMRGRIKSLQSVIFFTGTSKWLSVSGFAVPRRQLSSHAMKCDDEAVVQDMLYRIRQVNSMPQEVESKLLDFSVDGSRLGEVRVARRKVVSSIASTLCSFLIDIDNSFRITSKGHSQHCRHSRECVSRQPYFWIQDEY
jgi:hypothetical protein